MFSITVAKSLVSEAFLRVMLPVQAMTVFAKLSTISESTLTALASSAGVDEERIGAVLMLVSGISKGVAPRAD